jgi:hypothetical protein
LQFKLRNDSDALTADLREFVSLAGTKQWNRRIRQLSTEALRSPFLAKIVADYHWLELAINANFIELDATENLSKEPSLWSFAALKFAPMIVRTRERLSVDARTSLAGC